MTAQVAMLALGLLLGGDGKELTKQDLKLLQGVWRPVSVEINGKKIEDDLSKDRLTVKENRFEMKIGKDTMIGTLTLDATKEPKHIDTQLSTGPNKGQKSLGIYYFAKERLMVCYVVPPNPRPTEFRTAEGSSRALVVYERVKQ